jgi:hypothetical protein
MSLKNPVTPLGIDPGTVRLVAQRLNHYATPGPLLKEQRITILLSLRNTTHEIRTRFTTLSKGFTDWEHLKRLGRCTHVVQNSHSPLQTTDITTGELKQKCHCGAGSTRAFQTFPLIQTIHTRLDIRPLQN